MFKATYRMSDRGRAEDLVNVDMDRGRNAWLDSNIRDPCGRINIHPGSCRHPWPARTAAVESMVTGWGRNKSNK